MSKPNSRPKHSRWAQVAAGDSKTAREMVVVMLVTGSVVGGGVVVSGFPLHQSVRQMVWKE